jgi:hypothetical protein
MGSRCEETADVLDIVCGQQCPVAGFIVRVVGLHHKNKTFSATGILTGRRTVRPSVCYIQTVDSEERCLHKLFS